MKMRQILARKAAMVRTVSRKFGTLFKAMEIAVIFNGDTQQADIHVLQGVHRRIGWQSEMTRQAYRATVKWHGSSR